MRTADLLGIGSGLPLWPYAVLLLAFPAAVLLVRRSVRRRVAALLAAAEMGGDGG